VKYLLLALLLFGCGGGGGSSSTGTITPAPALRTDLLYGYFGQDALTVNETADHANLLWAADFYEISGQIAALTQAKAAGITKAIVMVPAYGINPPNDEAEMRLWLQRLDGVGVLDIVIGLAPIDEPNTERAGNRSDAEVTAKNLMLRRVMAEFKMRDRKLAVIYACKGSYPGIASYDWIGCDDYDRGCSVPTPDIRPDQRLILLPGGADPWRQDPACFESRAHGDSRVALLLPFVWQTVTDQGTTYRGIRENGLRTLYREAGCKIKGCK
jgi:hypothetical protein